MAALQSMSGLRRLTTASLARWCPESRRAAAAQTGRLFLRRPRLGAIDVWLLDQSPGDFRFAEVEARSPGPGQVLVQVVASVLNHLDLWLRQGMPRPGSLPIRAGLRRGRGRRRRWGRGVTRWKVGDEVVVNPSFACGHCSECLADRSVFCADWGIMGEHYWGAHGGSVVVGEANLVGRPAGRTRGKRRPPTVCAA